MQGTDTKQRHQQVRLQPAVSSALEEVQLKLETGGPVRVSKASAAGYAILWCRQLLNRTDKQDWPSLQELGGVIG